MEFSVSDIKCPISGFIMSDPVLCSDGFYYEKECIMEWLKNHNTSPITRKIISFDCYPSFNFKKKIEEFLNKNPELKKEQYIPLFTDNTIFLKKEDEIIDILNNINSISVNFSEINNWNFLKNDKICELLLEKTNDINKNIYSDFKLIDLFCEHSSLNIVMKIVNKYIELKLPIQKKNNKRDTINSTVYNENKEVLKYMLEKYIELKLPINSRDNCLKLNILESAILDGNKDIFDYIFNKFKEFNYLENIDYLTLLNLSKENGEIIDYILEKIIDLKELFIFDLLDREVLNLIIKRIDINLYKKFIMQIRYCEIKIHILKYIFNTKPEIFEYTVLNFLNKQDDKENMKKIIIEIIDLLLKNELKIDINNIIKVLFEKIIEFKINICSYQIIFLMKNILQN